LRALSPFEHVTITPHPVQRPIPAYVASFSQPSIELAARLGCNLIVAPFAAAINRPHFVT
jgi:alkanesulfonate monooxygenase SsuD/methylene tetrahydromethanopterin reductase-like flavin-dependent oxidoreductase (luciferase family)